MTSSDDRLRILAERIGSLLAEPTAPEELERLFAGADVRLHDAKVASLSPSSRFTLAYESSHGFALAALRARGYRPSHSMGHRRVTFDVLDVTAGASASLSSALARYHDRRNRMTYEGLLVATQAEADDLVRLVSELRGLVAKALRSPTTPPPAPSARSGSAA
jgi:hypothetical protein